MITGGAQGTRILTETRTVSTVDQEADAKDCTGTGLEGQEY